MQLLHLVVATSRSSNKLYIRYNVMYYGAIKIPQLSHEVFWNLIGIANCRVAEVNSLNLDKLPGRFFFFNGLGTRLL